MSSDGKGQRKYRRPQCPKCSDTGYMLLTVAPSGKMRRGYSVQRIACGCTAGRRLAK